MMFFKSAFTLSSLLVLASAMTFERNVPVQKGISFTTGPHAGAGSIREPSFSAAKSDCDKEDEADCKEFCGLSQATSTCSAYENKVTCYCKSSKGPASDCEERCVFCMPDKSAFEEASRVFKLGASKAQEL